MSLLTDENAPKCSSCKCFLVEVWNSNERYLYCAGPHCPKYNQKMNYINDDWKSTHKTAKRESVGYLFTTLDWNFIKALAQLAKHGSDKYDDPKDPVPNYQKGVLTRDKSPINHLCNHLTSYQLREPHDYFGSPKWHLVAIAFNAMMEFFHFPAEPVKQTIHGPITEHTLDSYSEYNNPSVTDDQEPL